MSLALMVLLPAAVILFWAIRIFLREDVRPMQLLMVLGMIMSVLTLFAGNDTALFMFPFFFLAIHEMTSGNGISKWYWLVLLPSIVFIPFRETMAFSVFLFFQIVFLSVWSIVKVNRYNALLSDFFDNGDDLSGDLSQTLVFLIATVVVIVIMMILPDDVISIFWVAVAFSLIISLLQFLMGSTVYNMKEVPEITPEMTAPETVISDTVSEVETETQAISGKADDRLLQRVISEKLYLDPMISLVSLAEELHTNRTYLSNSIHSCYNQNFSDFINTLRIGYALDLMKSDPENINIKEVALKSGYNHIQSFYRNFAIIMDMTPKTWLSKQ